MRRFLVVDLQGRLGNQLFEFASGYGLARNLGAELLFDSARIPRHELLLPSLIGPVYREASRSQLLRVGVDRYSRRAGRRWPDVTYRLITLSRRARRRTSPKIILDDLGDSGRYRAELNDLHLPALLRGYLQSEMYFSHISDEIVASIVFPSTVPRLTPSEGPTVAVSFRRGEYVVLGMALPWRYYEDALDKVTDQVPNPTLMLFGDDPAFVEHAAHKLSSVGPVLNALQIGDDPVSQLALMAQCDHAVIANSSFAWWGAWLGEQRDRSASRLVIAPAEYERGGDRLPERWTRLPTGLPTGLPLAAERIRLRERDRGARN